MIFYVSFFFYYFLVNRSDLSVELLLETSLRCFSIVNVSDIFHGFVLLIPIVAVAGGHPLGMYNINL